MSEMTAQTKQRIKQALIEHEQEQLRALEGQVTQQRAAAELDPDSVISVDDISQADEAGSLAAVLEKSAADSRAGLAEVEALTFAPTEVIVNGAVIGFGSDRYVVGVQCDAFEVDGHTYEGIAADAPLRPHIDGLRAGDIFTFNGREHRIEFVG